MPDHQLRYVKQFDTHSIDLLVEWTGDGYVATATAQPCEEAVAGVIRPLGNPTPIYEAEEAAQRFRWAAFYRFAEEQTAQLTEGLLDTDLFDPEQDNEEDE